jgi:hypothetical protein
VNWRGTGKLDTRAATEAASPRGAEAQIRPWCGAR